MTMTHAHDARANANMKEKAYGLMDSLPDTTKPNPNSYTHTHTHTHTSERSMRARTA
jgi:hypothetical protein